MHCIVLKHVVLLKCGGMYPNGDGSMFAQSFCTHFISQKAIILVPGAQQGMVLLHLCVPVL